MSLIWKIKELMKLCAPGEIFVALLFLVIPVLAILYSLLMRRWSALKHIAIFSAVVSIFSLVVLFADIQLPYHRPSSGGFFSLGTPSQGSAMALTAACAIAMLFSFIILGTINRIREFRAKRRNEKK